MLLYVPSKLPNCCEISNSGMKITIANKPAKEAIITEKIRASILNTLKNPIRNTSFLNTISFI